MCSVLAAEIRDDLRELDASIHVGALKSESHLCAGSRHNVRRATWTGARIVPSRWPTCIWGRGLRTALAVFGTEQTEKRAATGTVQCLLMTTQRTSSRRGPSMCGTNGKIWSVPHSLGRLAETLRPVGTERLNSLLARHTFIILALLVAAKLNGVGHGQSSSSNSLAASSLSGRRACIKQR